MRARLIRYIGLPIVLILVVAGLSACEGVPKCFGRAATIVGTPGNDTISGTDGDDVIVGMGGFDQVAGRGGVDRICVHGGSQFGVDGSRVGGDGFVNEAQNPDGGNFISTAGGTGPTSGNVLRGTPDTDMLLSGDGGDLIVSEGGGDTIGAGPPGPDHPFGLEDGCAVDVEADFFYDCETVVDQF